MTTSFLPQELYRGEVSVAFNGNPFFNDVSRGGIGYIDLLDSIGIDCYWPLITESLPVAPWVSGLILLFNMVVDVQKALGAR